MIFISSFFFFFFFYLISFILVLSSDDWFLIWLGLEINIITFIVIIYRRYRIINIESCLKYFFIQRLGSSLFIRIFYFSQFLESYFIIMILRIKIGAGPFYFWFPSVCRGLEWISCFFLISFQKILPLMLIVMFVGLITWFIIIIRIMFGLLGSFNQYNIKQLMAYSSIHHLGWVLLCNLFDDNLWMIYLFLYCIIIFRVIYILMDNEIINIYMIIKFKDKLWFSFSILRIRGIPPILGFFLKVIVFCYVLYMDFFIIFFLLLSSIVIFYIYFRLIYDIFIIHKDIRCWMNYCIYNNKFVISFLRIFGWLLGIFFIFFLF